MIEGDQTSQQFGPGRVETTRVIDTAVGILVGWRRCSTQTAFRELLTASERHRVPLFAMAGALVNLASEHTNSQAAGPVAEQGAEREWGENLAATADDSRPRHAVERFL